MKKRLYEILEKAKEKDYASKYFDIFIIFLILANVLSSIFTTVDSLYISYKKYFDGFELFSIVIFSIEFLLRLYVCTENKTYKKTLIGRIKYLFTPMAIIDLIAILPFYLPMFLPVDLRFLRILRLFRFFRLFKLGRYSKSMNILGNVFKKEKESIIIALIMCLTLILLSSSMLYFAESPYRTQGFSSIPEAMWWSVVTLTTVGYGDVHPVTILGKFLASIVAILGLGLVALPTAILSSGFISEMSKNKKSICPHCKKEIT